MDLTRLKVTYEELFELTNCSVKDYNKTQKVNDDIYVDSPHGYKKINACVVKPDCEMINIKFENGTQCNVARTHIFSVNGEEVFADDISYADTKEGKTKVKGKTPIGVHDGFDINVDYPHWYYSSDDIIYHNSLLMTDLLSGNIKDNKNILLISMEMMDAEVMKRVHANALDLPINHLTDLNLTDNQKNKIKSDEPQREFITKDMIMSKYNELKMSGKCGKLYVKDYPNGTFTPLMLDALLDSYKIEKGIEFDIIYLDYLGIMKSDIISQNAGLYSYIKSIVEETRAIAKKRQIPIVSASQLNRCLEKDTILVLKDETEKHIKDVKIGDVLCNDRKIVEVMNTKTQDCFRIKTKNGKELICSRNHKIPTNHGTMTIDVGLKVGQKVNTK